MNGQGREVTPRPHWAIRLALVVLGLGGWFWTQSLLGQRAFASKGIGDGLLELLAPAHHFLIQNPAYADGLLIVSSAIIDLLGIFLLVWSILGPSMRPFLGLLILFGLRQICQALCALPPPPGMIWHAPGFPSLLVTYDVSNDLFFSGHTALAVYGAVEVARLGRGWLVGLGVFIALFEAAVVMVLKAHYTMDVFAGAITALYVAGLAAWLAPSVDRALARLVPRRRSDRLP